MTTLPARALEVKLPTLRRGTLLREVEMLARTHTEDCIAVLHEIATNRANPAVARVSAAEALLDRGWGRSPQTVRVESPVDALTDDQLERAIVERIRQIAADEGRTVEGRVVPDTPSPSAPADPRTRDLPALPSAIDLGPTDA